MKQIRVNYFWGILSAIFAVGYFYLVYRFSANIPMDDDLGVLRNLTRLVQSEHMQEKMSVMFENGNGHRTLFLYTVVWMVYAVCGHLNFSVCIFITNLLLLGTGILMYQMNRNKDRRGLWACLIVLLLFNGQNLGNSLIAQFGLANIGSVFITFFSIYLLLINHRAAFVGGLLLSVITIYSNGNGMLIIPPVIACFCIQKRIKELICFGIISVTAALLYFYGLDTSRLEGDIRNNLPVLVLNFFVFIGNNVWIPAFSYISIFTGMVCSVIYVWGICNKVYKQNLFCYACLTFLFITAAAVVVGNAPVLGGESTTPWRYRIYGSLFLILTAGLLVNNAKAFYLKKAIYLFPVLALLFSLFSTAYCYRKGERRWELKKVSAWRWVNEGQKLGTCYPSAEPELIRYLKEAEQMGIYKMPQYPLSAYKSVLRSVPDQNRQTVASPDILYGIESVDEKEGFLLLEGWAYLQSESMSMESEDIFLYLINEEGQWICRPYFERRFDIINDTRKADCGFFAVIDKTEIPPGTYRLEIGLRSRLKLKRPVFCVSTGQVYLSEL
ncbi:MAG: hypothetical protein LBH90_09485 [Tannerella sp.]|jgi:hypothetical protein|nr:hypothetical protein [Tannerella sp.]